MAFGNIICLWESVKKTNLPKIDEWASDNVFVLQFVQTCNLINIMFSNLPVQR